MKHYSNLGFEQFYDKMVGSNADLQGDIMTVSQQLIEKGALKGIEQGIIKGEKLGEHKKALATARNMLSRGYDAKEVAELNNLSLEEVNALAKEVNGKKH